MPKRLPPLQPRLAAIAQWVPAGAHLTDVGTDHGYLPLHLLAEGRIASAIATDIRPGPLDNARHSARESGIPLDCRLCGGRAAVRPGETHTIVIAGMGGETMIHILSEAPWAREGPALLLQPMAKSELLRAWLPANGCRIVRERVVEDRGVLYPILSCRGGGHPPPLTAGQAWVGLARGDPLYPAYAAQRIQSLRRAADGLSQASDPASRQRAQELLDILKEVEEMV